VDRKKIAGILIQNAMSGSNLSKSLVGIGLNVNEKHFPEQLPNPVSLCQLIQQETDLLEEMHHLMSILKRNYDLLKKSPQKITKCYFIIMFQIMEWAHYQIKESIVEAQIKGTDEFGRLALEYKSGELHYFDLKEVKFVL
jgi:BirA family biotin operon repressor/biotin-[acetyl-CoA-carboxylase] ligase